MFSISLRPTISIFTFGDVKTFFIQYVKIFALQANLNCFIQKLCMRCGFNEINITSIRYLKHLSDRFNSNIWYLCEIELIKQNKSSIFSFYSLDFKKFVRLYFYISKASAERTFCVSVLLYGCCCRFYFLFNFEKIQIRVTCFCNSITVSYDDAASLFHLFFFLFRLGFAQFTVYFFLFLTYFKHSKQLLIHFFRPQVRVLFLI